VIGRSKSLKIYISGLYSGPNPSPGVGIARSLREAYPEAVLVGVDYSNRSFGIHWRDFDEIWLQRPWEELDLEEYLSQILGILDSGAFWISGLDLEILWLAQSIPAHPNLLTPRIEALGRVGKPAIPAHEALPFRIPPFVRATVPDWHVHAFCRRHGWNIWLKGPYYEARRVRSWIEVVNAWSELSATWSSGELFLQAHIAGNEESIAFCAYDGELLGCIHMSKHEITPEGKAWSGEVTEVPGWILDPLKRVVYELRWTGGAELELIRDASGGLWLIEWNPRFPAWIHGATIAGYNLPALLVERASGLKGRRNCALGKQFVRVVMEIPARPEYPLPAVREVVRDGFDPSTKHPSGMPMLAKRMWKEKGEPPLRMVEKGGRAVALDISNVIQDLESLDLGEVDTPYPVFLPTVATLSFGRSADKCASLSSDVRIALAYSVKTNPDRRLLELAYKHGLLAEVISQLELEKALSVGFDPARIVLNGPGKWWPRGINTEAMEEFHAVFCDSLEEFESLVRRLSDGEHIARFVGVRLRLPGVRSRFGVTPTPIAVFQRLVSSVETLPQECSFGIHFHVASSTVGVENWFRLYEGVLAWAATIEELSGVRVRCLDLGGGWFPDDWWDTLIPRLDIIVHRACKMLDSLEEVILEPGKALSQSCMAVVTRVLEVRRSARDIEAVVVDASIAELPEATHYPHRILYRMGHGKWTVLGSGDGIVLGRLCMEEDVLAVNVRFPDEIKPGDILVVCDAGAYDRSMSYEFGRG
jgi:diaminopimelate decarboxylase